MEKQLNAWSYLIGGIAAGYLGWQGQRWDSVILGSLFVLSGIYRSFEKSKRK